MHDNNGRFEYDDGKVYVGSFENGKQHGKGQMIFKDKQVVDASWVEGESQDMKNVNDISKSVIGDQNTNRDSNIKWENDNDRKVDNNYENDRRVDNNN